MSYIAHAAVTIDSVDGPVWAALLSPKAIKQYMFGATVTTDWAKGSPIIWKGEWEGKPYEDKGVVLDIEQGRTLRYSHFSPLAGLPDAPENYHEVKIELVAEGERTVVLLEQGGNRTDEAREDSAKNWLQMLEGLKTYVER